MRVGVVHSQIGTGAWRLIQAILTADWSLGAKRQWDGVPFDTVDWSIVAHLAWQYKLRPMMARALREAGWPGVPAAVRSEIEHEEQLASRQAIHQLNLLNALVRRTAAQSVRLLTIKGVALSLHLYGDPFVREAYDLDLLVHPDDVARLNSILAELNCTPVEAGPPLTPRQTAILDRYRYHSVHRQQGSGLQVENHWRLDRNPHLITTDFDALWRSRQEIMLAGGTIAVPSDDDLVQQLGTHAARHRWERWKWIVDLITILRTLSDADFARLRAMAERDGNANQFDSWLIIIEAVTGFAPPPAARRRAEANRRAHRLAAMELRHAVQIRRRPIHFTTADVLREAVHHVQIKHTPGFLAGELGALIHREEDWYALRLPDRLIWLYYACRPFSFLIRAAKDRFDGLQQGDRHERTSKP
jgi:hypothetical protein